MNVREARHRLTLLRAQREEILARCSGRPARGSGHATKLRDVEHRIGCLECRIDEALEEVVIPC